MEVFQFCDGQSNCESIMSSGPSTARKLTFATATAGCFAFAYYFITNAKFDGVFKTLRWKTPSEYNQLRMNMILFCIGVQTLQSLFWVFVLNRKIISYDQIVGLNLIRTMINFIHILLVARINSGINWMDIIGLLLFIGGSFAQTSHEYLRHRWISNPKNSGKPYIDMFLGDIVAHPNYTASVVHQTGMAMITHWWFNVFLAIVLHVSNFKNDAIPKMQSQTTKKYGQDYELYLLRKKNMIPFVW